MSYALPRGGGGGRIYMRYMLLPDAATEFIGRGIVPDMHAETGRADIVSGDDPALKRALELIS